MNEDEKHHFLNIDSCLCYCSNSDKCRRKVHSRLSEQTLLVKKNLYRVQGVWSLNPIVQYFKKMYILFNELTRDCLNLTVAFFFNYKMVLSVPQLWV